MRTPDIGMADLARALRALQPVDGARAVQVARALGMAVAPNSGVDRATPARPDGEVTRPRSDPSRTQPTAPDSTGPYIAGPAVTELDIAGPDIVGPVATPTRQGHRRGPPPQPGFRRPLALPAGRVPLRPSWWEITDGPRWLSASEPLPTATPVPGPRWPEPLFVPTRTAALVDDAVRHLRPGRELDLPVVVDALARVRLPVPLPHISRWTSASRVWVLTDTGPGMQPFVTDQQDLIEAVEREVGADRVDVLLFDGDPNRRTVDWTHPAGRPTEPPGPDTVLVVASDLGLGGPAGGSGAVLEQAWLQFARSMAALAVPVVVFVPLPALRWRHLAVARVLAVCEWDRRTTVAGLRALLQDVDASR